MLHMAISPFSARPASPEGERRRARLALMIAAVGIAAMLLAYAISPGVRHAVGHAHSVKHTVGNVFDHDHGSDDHPRAQRPATKHS
jgi:alcohol dehydrogenase class IV